MKHKEGPLTPKVKQEWIMNIAFLQISCLLLGNPGTALNIKLCYMFQMHLSILRQRFLC
jgi:hypothetical protein